MTEIPQQIPQQEGGILSLLGKKWKPTRSRKLVTIQGYYFDPKHGGCFRNITKNGRGKYIILGVYGNDEKREPGQFWSAIMDIMEETDDRVKLNIYFHNKEKDDKVMSATFSRETKIITWDDGNKWLPCYCHPRQLQWNGCHGFMTNTYAGSIQAS